jgi:hypothetical protein
MKSQSIFIFFLIILLSCSNNNNKNNKNNVIIDTITRNDKDFFYSFEKAQKNKKVTYSFESEPYGFFKITKEFFRCKGNPLNIERVDTSNLDDVKVYLDCPGPLKHGLPLINGKENVYPVLVDILNFIQKKIKKRVIITCGHRCPKHNSYSDLQNNAKTSKHMIGAEVDFYVQGLEDNPEKIIDLIFAYYKESSKYKGLSEFINFNRYQAKTDVAILPWYNKEIFIKLYKADEGRDFDNRHPFSYIAIQVLFDINTNQKVNYSWDKAYRGFLQF